jgi:hypothetical protein
VAVLIAAGSAMAQVVLPSQAATSYLVFFRGQPIGREEVSVVSQADGWFIRGSSRLGPPVDVTTRTAEVTYDPDWRPKSLLIDGVLRGQDVTIKTTFADGAATNEILVQGQPQSKTDKVSADPVVLLNSFLGSYTALARRVRDQAAGATLRAYIAPQAEIAIAVVSVTTERIQTPNNSVAATHYALRLINPQPGGEVPVDMWVDQGGELLRMSIPSQTLEMAREDVASAVARTVAFEVPGDEAVTIPASGFNLAGTMTPPRGAAEPRPALVLVGGSGPVDRDETVAGIPIFGHIARDLSAAGFLVVRYDKRGVGQSGGRTESATLSDYAEDARAVVQWLSRRKDVDRRRIGIVGHSEGAGVAMLLAARERGRVAAVALLAGLSTTGSAVVLEQQKDLLDRSKLDDAAKAERVALQEKINQAVMTGKGWEGIPEDLRKRADTPWFQSLLSFDAAKAMRDVRQPLLIVNGELDTQVLPYHADKLAELARQRKGRDVQVVKLPGLNHLFVAAKTGEVSEYPSLGPNAQVSKELTSAIAEWMGRVMMRR